MDVSGQGKIDTQFVSKTLAEAGNKQSNANHHVIHFEPVFKVKIVPTHVPHSGSDGGMILLHQGGHQTMHVKGVGQGAGSLVLQSPGPVLIGAVSFFPDVRPALLVIVVVLSVLMAIIWAITHLICHTNVADSRKKQRVLLERTKGNWIEDSTDNKSENSTINRLSMLLMKTEAQSNRPRISFENYRPLQLLSSSNPNMNNAASQLSIQDSVTPIWSTLASIDEAYFSTHSVFGSSSVLNPILESPGLGLLFTISEFKAPNTWQRRNMAIVSHCKPSAFEECLEVFLLARESILVGKMKNDKAKRSEGEFVIQMWKTFDGSLTNGIPKESNSYQSCEACCPARDEFLMLIRLGELVVWNVESNRLVSFTALPNSHTLRAAHSVQITKNQSNVIVLNLHLTTGTATIYTGVLDQIITGSRDLITRMISSRGNVFSVISDTSILIGSETGEVTMWDFFNNLDTLITYEDEKIQKILNSPSKCLALIQSDHKICIWKTDQWVKVFEIVLLSVKVCSLCLSTNTESQANLAIALDNGFIQIYDVFSGTRIKQFATYLPIMNMLFSANNQTLIAMADRASLYQLFLFNIQ